MITSFNLILSIFTVAAHAGKRGLTWPFYNGSLNPRVLNNGDGQVVVIYDYETFLPPTTGGIGNLGFIGMQRCLDCPSSPISQLFSRRQSQQWATVFTLNEPDLNGISPASAATWYMKNINPLPIKKALPAVSSSATSGQGLSWVSEMINACAGRCSFDYINLVVWIPRPSFSEFQSYVESAHARFPGQNLVITEFALQSLAGGQAAQVAFFRQAFQFLDSAPYVTLYFPFVATSPSLLRKNDPSGASFVDTGSCLYNDDGSASPVGALMS
ncbi:glycosyl hydrolase catalytic core-domain-containing protein [Chiua virens]|nr:glycosyl hydrolase catalytic core-domain-containing protein [Chiua virens]